MTFKAKYQVVAVMVLIAAIVVAVALALQCFEDPRTRVLGVGLLILIATFPLWCYPHRYEMRDGWLYIRAGVVTVGKLDLMEVVSVKVAKVWPPLSHLVWPTEGLQLIKKKGRVLVIPRDIASFVEEMHRQQTNRRQS